MGATHVTHLTYVTHAKRRTAVRALSRHAAIYCLGTSTDECTCWTVG